MYLVWPLYYGRVSFWWFLVVVPLTLRSDEQCGIFQTEISVESPLGLSELPLLHFLPLSQAVHNISYQPSLEIPCGEPWPPPLHTPSSPDWTPARLKLIAELQWLIDWLTGQKLICSHCDNKLLVWVTYQAEGEKRQTSSFHLLKTSVLKIVLQLL